MGDSVDIIILYIPRIPADSVCGQQRKNREMTKTTTKFSVISIVFPVTRIVDTAAVPLDTPSTQGFGKGAEGVNS